MLFTTLVHPLHNIGCCARILLNIWIGSRVLVGIVLVVFVSRMCLV
jgi:hypothetical protein